MKTKPSAEADLAARITKIRDYFCKGNNIDFANRIGDYTANTSSYCNGTKNASLKVLYKIAYAFPELDKTWLVFGEGNMLAADNRVLHIVPQETEQKKEAIDGGLEEINRLIGIIEEKDKHFYSVIAKKDQQISDLISMIKPTV